MMFAVFFLCAVLTVMGVHAGPKCPAKDGPDSVYFPHKDCSKFWQCSNGTPYLFDCPASLHFNPKLNVCDWPDQAGCEGGSGSTGSGSDEDSSSSDSSGSSESIEEDGKSEEEPSVEDDNTSIDEDNSGSSSSSSSESNEGSD